VATAASGREERRTVDGVTLQVYRGGQGPTLLVLHDCEVMTEWQPFHTAWRRAWCWRHPIRASAARAARDHR
jgi:hypothetical protein